MKQAILSLLVVLIFIGTAYSQNNYPNNEDGPFEDMLTPQYYYSENGDAFRLEINEFIHFSRLASFHHPFENPAGEINEYNINRGFGDGIGANGTVQHHPAIDLHLVNNGNETMYAA